MYGRKPEYEYRSTTRGVKWLQLYGYTEVTGDGMRLPFTKYHREAKSSHSKWSFMAVSNC